MKFPITRETLQAFDYAKDQEELKEEELKERVTQMIENLCNEFKMNIRSNSQQKKFAWHLNSNNIHSIRIRNQNSKFSYTLDEYLPRIIDKLKEIFIGCDIIIDPLKTYLIIDWS